MPQNKIYLRRKVLMKYLWIWEFDKSSRECLWATTWIYFFFAAFSSQWMPKQLQWEWMFHFYVPQKNILSWQRRRIVAIGHIKCKVWQETILRRWQGWQRPDQWNVLFDLELVILYNLEKIKGDKVNRYSFRTAFLLTSRKGTCLRFAGEHWKVHIVWILARAAAAIRRVFAQPQIFHVDHIYPRIWCMPNTEPPDALTGLIES